MARQLNSRRYEDFKHSLTNVFDNTILRAFGRGREEKA